LIYLLKLVIFHSYVSLPEGKLNCVSPYCVTYFGIPRIAETAQQNTQFGQQELWFPEFLKTVR
jgi:hypothetical protein